jgi:hypothetical protein
MDQNPFPVKKPEAKGLFVNRGNDTDYPHKSLLHQSLRVEQLAVGTSSNLTRKGVNPKVDSRAR